MDWSARLLAERTRERERIAKYGAGDPWDRYLKPSHGVGVAQTQTAKAIEPNGEGKTMGLKLAIRNYEALPADMYPAVMSRYEEKETEYGQAVVLYFTISDGDYAGREVSGLASATLASKSKLRGWLEGILGRPFGSDLSELDLDRFLGKACRLTLKIVPGKDGTGEFNRIESILPIRSAKPAPKPVVAEGDGSDLF